MVANIANTSALIVVYAARTRCGDAGLIDGKNTCGDARNRCGIEQCTHNSLPHADLLVKDVVSN